MVAKKGGSSTKGGAKKAGAKKGTAKAAPKKGMAKAASNQHTRIYATSMSSLKALELTCEKDEADLSARILSLQLATNDGEDVTAGIYEDDDETELGELTFEEYKTAVDEQSIMAIHQTQGDTFLFKGEAYVKNNEIKLLAFRDKP